MAIVVCLAVLDYFSTYAFLRLSGSNSVYESGLIAGLALQRDGFRGWLIIDIFAVIIIFCSCYHGKIYLHKTWIRWF